MKSERKITRLGIYLQKYSVNKAEIARRTGLSKARINELSNNPNSHLRADELYRIAKAMHTDPCEMLNFIFEESD